MCHRTGINGCAPARRRGKTMFARFAVIAPAAYILLASALPCAAQARNCPAASDQLVVVNPGEPTVFRLAVDGFDASTSGGSTSGAIVSVFQYPLGGVLQQSGPTPLDFVFLANPDFNGTTLFTYRLTPPTGCPGGTQFGQVDLVGGFSDSTASGLVPTVPPRLCGVTFPLGVVASALACLIGVRARGGRRLDLPGQSQRRRSCR